MLATLSCYGHYFTHCEVDLNHEQRCSSALVKASVDILLLVIAAILGLVV